MIALVLECDSEVRHDDGFFQVLDKQLGSVHKRGRCINNANVFNTFFKEKEEKRVFVVNSMVW